MLGSAPSRPRFGRDAGPSGLVRGSQRLSVRPSATSRAASLVRSRDAREKRLWHDFTAHLRSQRARGVREATASAWGGQKLAGEREERIVVVDVLNGALILYFNRVIVIAELCQSHAVASRYHIRKRRFSGNNQESQRHRRVAV